MTLQRKEHGIFVNEKLDDAMRDHGQTKERREEGKKTAKKSNEPTDTPLLRSCFIIPHLSIDVEEGERKITRCWGVSHGYMHMTCLCRSTFPSFFVFNDVMDDSLVFSDILFTLLAERERERKEKRTTIAASLDTSHFISPKVRFVTREREPVTAFESLSHLTAPVRIDGVRRVPSPKNRDDIDHCRALITRMNQKEIDVKRNERAGDHA